MLKAHVVFATITGNNEAIADIVTDKLNDLGVHTVESDMSQTDPTEFKDDNICVVCSYTYNNGDLHLPFEGVDFYEDLKLLDLSNQVYGVAGSGDTFYKKHYNVAVDKFDQAFKQAKAKPGAKRVKINLSPDENDIKTLDTFTKQLISTAKDKLVKA
ncbi:flavodoxin [Acetilactobacillus jinshanensis]|uniref:Flavodoxin n=1 Tax=Acetilactobacillus jinshanensis TaxID=1720083 RepID=A0A4P6ZLI6_9LACO|nr:flavodoxin [Acetilactobacillus jinshanensis]QBP18100.1 flavodoxin [Acetilactobacillus jinshanensis]URL60963.1 flavodoxin [uncultured bacterium]